MANPFQPSTALQTVYTTKAGSTPSILASPVTVTDFTTSPLVPGGTAYGEYLAAVGALAPANPTFGDGVRIGYTLLTSAPAEGAIGCFASRALAQRKARGVGAGFLDAATDIWRLIIENGGDIAAVLKRI